MRPAAKRAGLGLALGIGVPFLAWSGALLYWHFRITGAIRGIEARGVWPTGMDGLHRPELETLLAAGCRSIPYLLRELGSSRNRPVLENATHVIKMHLASRKGMSQEESLTIWGCFQESPFTSEDSPEERGRNFAHIARLWEEHRPRHHPWWRVWSSGCGP